MCHQKSTTVLVEETHQTVGTLGRQLVLTNKDEVLSPPKVVRSMREVEYDGLKKVKVPSTSDSKQPETSKVGLSKS